MEIQKSITIPIILMKNGVEDILAVWERIDKNFGALKVF
jgi:hypothetical protein